MITLKTLFNTSIFIIFFILTSLSLFAQQGRLIGIVDNTLVEINRENASLSEICNVNIPFDATVSNLAYSVDDCVFYTIASLLIKINGEINTIQEAGSITLIK